MLDNFIRRASKFFISVLFTILIAAFAIWGIGPAIRVGGDAPLAKVGSQSISAEEFMTAVQNRRQAVAAQLGRPITAEQARAFGLDAQVLSELVNGAAVTVHAKDLGLHLSDATVAEAIRNDPLFQGPEKTFSRAVFNERMRQAGLSEGRYFVERREGTLRDEITQSLSDAVTAPEAMLDVLHRYREETRIVAYMVLDQSKADKPADPDDEKLKATYEQQKRRFVVPERRSFTALVLTRAEVDKRAEVTDAEVKAEYDRDPASWGVPERRRVQQIRLKSRDQATAVAKEIAAGKSMLLAALETGEPQPTVELVARRDIGDAKVAGAIFSLPIDKVSEPIEVRGNVFVLAKVTEIQPAVSRSFDEVKGEIRDNLAGTRQRDVAGKLHDQIEDLRGAGKTLAEIGKELGLKVEEVKGADKTGKGADGNPVLKGPDAAKLVAAAFESQKGVPHDVVELSEGAEGWIDLGDVTPEAQRPFEEVKADVKALWLEGETKTALTALGNEIVEKIKAGATLEIEAKARGLKVETTRPVKRTDQAPPLTAAALRQAFTLAKGAAGAAEGVDAATRVVFAVADIKVPDAPTAEQRDRLRKDLTRQIQTDVLGTYVGALREKYGMTVNEQVYRRAVGLDKQ